MTFWSYPVIMVPSMAIMIFALMQVIKGIETYTGYEVDDILLVGHKQAEGDSPGTKSRPSKPAAAVEESVDP